MQQILFFRQDISNSTPGESSQAAGTLEAAPLRFVDPQQLSSVRECDGAAP